MAKLEFALKGSELKKAFKEQRSTGRVVLSVSLPEDKNERLELDAMYGFYIAAHKRRGELGFAEIVIKKKEDGRMVDMRFNVRILAVRLIKKEYQIEIRFADPDLFT